MELREYIRIFRKSWLLIVLATLLGVGAGAGYSALQSPKYESSTVLYVSARAGDSTGTGDIVQGNSFARQQVASYVDIVASAKVLDRVVADLDLPTSSRALASNISASTQSNTALITITVSSTDPEEAAQIAAAVGETFADVVVNDLEKPDGNRESLVKISTIEPPVVATSASSPKVAINTLLGLMLGLALGIGVALLRGILDTRIHNTHDLEQVTDRPVLGGIAYDPDTKDRPLIVHADPRNPRSESFRALRTNLQFVNADSTSRSFVMTSSLPGEGKSTTISNLALALAQSGARVILIDGDLRLSRLAQYFDIEGGAGLTDVLIGRADLADVTQKWGRTSLDLLPAGGIPPNPSELLGSKAMAKLLDHLGQQYDFVLIDAPPLLLVTDAAILARLTGGAIVAVRSGSTKKAELAAALRALDHVKAHVAGLVVTMLPTKGPDSYGYGQYGYGQYGYDDEIAPDTKDATKRAKKRAKFGPKRTRELTR